MATPVFDSLLSALSLKIGDPVSAPASDGQIFSCEQKTNYLNRAYNRLRRILASTTKDEEIVLPNLAEMVTITDAEDITSLTGTGLAKSEIGTGVRIIKQVFITSATSTIQCNYLDPAKYLPVTLGINDYYNTDGDKAYYTEMAGKVLIIAPTGFTTISVSLYCLSDVPTYVQGGEDDLLINPMHQDLLLALAAKEAMQDRGDAISIQKVTMYDNDFFGEVKIMAQRQQVNPETEEIK